MYVLKQNNLDSDSAFAIFPSSICTSHFFDPSSICTSHFFDFQLGSNPTPYGGKEM